MDRKLKVTGSGKMKFKPEVTVVSFIVYTVRKTYEETLKAAAEELDSLKYTIETAGFDRNSVKTAGFNVSDEEESYEDDKGVRKYKHVGFRCAQALKIEFDIDNKRLGKLLYLLSKGEVYSSIELNYTVKNKEDAKNQLLAKAVENAKERAEILAKAGGVQLGEIELIDYSWGMVSFETANYYRMDRCSSVCYDGEASLDFDINPDDIESTDNVTIVWNIK